MNAYLHYRRDKINPERKVKMTDHSKITASNWKEENESIINQYHQTAAKVIVEKETASGGNGNTIKTYEQVGKIGFVNETPVKKQVADFNVNSNGSHKSDTSEVCEDIFEQFTINTDFFVNYEVPIDSL